VDLTAESPERERSLLDSDAQAIKDALASTASTAVFTAGLP
jgi:hypothetical protein